MFLTPSGRVVVAIPLRCIMLNCSRSFNLAKSTSPFDGGDDDDDNIDHDDDDGDSLGEP